jgi:dihydroorotate dehydrogenase
MRRLARVAFRGIKPVLHALDAETAHTLTLDTLRVLPAGSPAPHDPQLAISIAGLAFPNPIGLAAGFDKNADVARHMLGLGFGFVEVGTTTPLPQTGNAKPRLFRLQEDEAVINRMGFNNEGHEAMLRKLQARAIDGIVGVNIGANKDSPDRLNDYVRGVKVFGNVASYLTINISSPNTPGLRSLQSADDLKRLLELTNAERSKLSNRVPMMLKIAPDLETRDLEGIARACIGQVDAIIVSNTTTSRPQLRSRLAAETGGLSGKPLFALSTQQLARLFLLTEGRIPLIGVGGVRDVETAYAKFKAGASLVQLYSALVYNGPGLVGTLIDGLKKRLGSDLLSRVVGSDAETLAHQTEPGT